MDGTRLFNARGSFGKAAEGDLHHARLVFGLGKKAVGLSMELDCSVMGNKEVTLRNDDYTITVTSKKPGAIGKAFFDVFELNIE